LKRSGTGHGKPLQIAVDSAPGTTGRRSNAYRPSSCHGIVGSDGIRRCMMCGRSIVIGGGGLERTCAPLLRPTSPLLDVAPSSVKHSRQQQRDRDDDQRNEDHGLTVRHAPHGAPTSDVPTGASVGCSQ